MAEAAQIKRFLEKLDEAHPYDFFRIMNDRNTGMGAVLLKLVRADGSMTAGRLSEELSVSTARITILLKKMASKGLLTRERSPKDARVTVVRITEEGRAAARQMREDIFASVGSIIDSVGEERLLQMLDTLGDIRRAVKCCAGG